MKEQLVMQNKYKKIKLFNIYFKKKKNYKNNILANYSARQKLLLTTFTRLINIE